ncbi:SEFIR domain-containing protein [Actinoplanes sp. NBRC 101535]|uniref:SEFIR domain-containing protein n=1 Tax=Actinoplanes sp. NBRC 101535 TaxID=3032196 RepID=UPI0025529D9E|nr:SEFIR domain-containing protein [Actinoplanes sp. NBRC 101535]
MPRDEGPASRAFISYAHDSGAHRDRVRAFWHFLRTVCNVDAWCDFSAEASRTEWTRTMESAMDAAEFILVIASPQYRLRAGPDLPPTLESGRGVAYEASLLRDRSYRDPVGALRQILPVVLPGCSADDIPGFLLRHSTTHYPVSSFTVAGAEQLVRVLTHQPAEIVPDLGGRTPELSPRPVPDGERDRLVAALRTLPVMSSPEAREYFATMVAERLRPPFPAGPGGREPDVYLHDLVMTLATRNGDLWAVADTVHALHEGQPIDDEVRELVERLTMIG